MASDRSWIGRHKDSNGRVTDEYMTGVHGFLDFAFSHEDYVEDNKIKCPCRTCKLKFFKTRDDVELELRTEGFMLGYDRWINHGESSGESDEDGEIGENTHNEHEMDMNAMENMVRDAAGIDFNWSAGSEQEQPNRAQKKFFDLLQAADEPLYDGCTKYTKLSALSQLFNLKSEFNMSGSCYDRMMDIVKGMLPEGEKLPHNLYGTKKELEALGLAYEKIDACKNNCMLYYKESQNLQECSVCRHPRYKLNNKRRRPRKVPYKVLHYLPITPRLQRLYMSSNTAEHMTWHKKPCDTGTMTHPAHGEAWKHFDEKHLLFASEERNIRIGLCTDGFTPFNKYGRSYSCWPVIIAIYNLPPWMCMQQPYLFLSMVIPGPKGPGKSLDVFLRPLIDELKKLWVDGIETFDVSKNETFLMRAAVLWTISDFHAYAMLSGWSTHGRLACPYCMGRTKSFRLKHGGKTSWFDCHRQFLHRHHRYRKERRKFKKARVENDPPPRRLSGEEIRAQVEQLPDIVFGTESGKQDIPGFKNTHNWVKKSIFWELPYWHSNLIRHNLDVMHIEKNVFDNIFYTIMDVKGKTKDNAKARQDLVLHCNRPELHLKDVNGNQCNLKHHTL